MKINLLLPCQHYKFYKQINTLSLYQSYKHTSIGNKINYLCHYRAVNEEMKELRLPDDSEKQYSNNKIKPPKLYITNI